MKINNDFGINNRATFNNSNGFESFSTALSVPFLSQNNSSEKVALKKPLKADKFDKYSEVSRNEIIALVLSLSAAAVVIGFGIAEIFKRPLS